MSHHTVRPVVCALILLCLSAIAEASVVPDRRKPQFSNESGYAVFPYPYSLPGIGQGLGLVGGSMNIDGSYTDVYGMAFGGDATGIMAGIGDVHLIDRTLITEIGVSRISKATIESYQQRGMGAGKYDYSLLELGGIQEYGARLTSTFFDRRFEI